MQRRRRPADLGRPMGTRGLGHARSRAMTTVLMGLALTAHFAGAHANPSPEIVADTMPRPLTTTPGDAERGRAIIIDRQRGLCLLCHSGPFPEERTPGNVSTDLTGVGSRYTVAQLRLRVADSRRLNPQSLMPSFYQPSRATKRIATSRKGEPILTAQEIEDVVAFLVTLK